MRRLSILLVAMMAAITALGATPAQAAPRQVIRCGADPFIAVISFAKATPDPQNKRTLHEARADATPSMDCTDGSTAWQEDVAMELFYRGWIKQPPKRRGGFRLDVSMSTIFGTFEQSSRNSKLNYDADRDLWVGTAVLRSADRSSRSRVQLELVFSGEGGSLAYWTSKLEMIEDF